MKKSIFYVFLVALCTMISCNNKQRGSYMDTVIPDSLYAFMQQNDSLGLKLVSRGSSSGKAQREGEAVEFADANFIQIYSSEDATLFDALINKYKYEAIDSLNPMSENYFVLMDEDEMKKNYNYQELRDQLNKAVDKYILPSFHVYMQYIYGINYDFTTVCGLPADYKILIMKSGRDYVLPDNSTWKFEWKMLPAGLKHGYTSGIAYRNATDKIFYWCIAW